MRICCHLGCKNYNYHHTLEIRHFATHRNWKSIAVCWSVSLWKEFVFFMAVPTSRCMWMNNRWVCFRRINFSLPNFIRVWLFFTQFHPCPVVFKWARGNSERAYEHDKVQKHNQLQLMDMKIRPKYTHTRCMRECNSNHNSHTILTHTDVPPATDRPNGRVTAAWAVIAIVINISKDHKLHLVLLLWRWMNKRANIRERAHTHRLADISEWYCTQCHINLINIRLRH